jgi:hypothetical protein
MGYFQREKDKWWGIHRGNTGTKEGGQIYSGMGGGGALGSFLRFFGFTLPSSCRDNRMGIDNRMRWDNSETFVNELL